MKRKFAWLILSCLMVAALLLTSCGLAEAADEEEGKMIEEGVVEGLGLPSTNEIVKGVFESLNDIKTFQFDMEMTADMSGEAEGEVFDTTMTMGFNGVLDTENRQMRADISMSMEMPDEDEIEMEMAMYIIDDTGYVMMNIPEMGPTWMKSNVIETEWAEASGQAMGLTESQQELLESSTVKILGSEQMDGIECYVLELIPDMEQLWLTIMQQAQISGEETLPELEIESLKEILVDDKQP